MKSSFPHANRFFPLFILLCLLGVTGCRNETDSGEVLGVGNTYPPETIAALDKIVETNLLKFGIPGSILGIWQEGYEPLFLTNGKGDLVSGRKPSITDHFRMASNTKMFTALAVLMLAGEGKLLLDDKVSKYLPEIPYADQITVRQLANHTSGLYDYADTEEFLAVSTLNPLKKWTPGEFIDLVKNKPLGFGPGTQLKYCNTGYIILGLLVEKISGMAWETFVTERILKPLGLTNTFCPIGPGMPAEYIKGYQTASGTTSEIVVDPSKGWAAGSMISTLSDLKTWLDAVRKDTLLSPSMAAERRKWVPYTIKEWYYGFGLLNIKNTYFGHGGSIDGYNSFAFTSFDGKKTIILLFNRDAGATETAVEIMAYLFK